MSGVATGSAHITYSTSARHTGTLPFLVIIHPLDVIIKRMPVFTIGGHRWRPRRFTRSVRKRKTKSRRGRIPFVRSAIRKVGRLRRSIGKAKRRVRVTRRGKLRRMHGVKYQRICSNLSIAKWRGPIKRYHKLSFKQKVYLQNCRFIKLVNDINFGRLSPSGYTVNSVAYVDNAGIWSLDMLHGADMDSFAKYIVVNGIGTNGYYQLRDNQTPNTGITYSVVDIYNTLQGNTNSATSSYFTGPGVLWGNWGYYVESYDIELEFRNQNTNGIWVEMWEAHARRDVPDLGIALGHIYPGASGQWGGSGDSNTTIAEECYRNGALGSLLANAASAFTQGGGTTFNNTNGAVMRPGQAVSMRIGQCTLYNKWFKSMNFRRIFVNPGCTWHATFRSGRSYVDTMIRRTDAIQYFRGTTKTFMMRYYGAASHNITGGVGSNDTTLGGPWIQCYGKVNIKLSYIPEPRRTSVYVNATSLLSTTAGNAQARGALTDNQTLDTSISGNV